MNFIIDELDIKLDTNIPKDQDDIETISFTIDKLHHPIMKDIKLQLNTYPYFTSDVLYPETLDYLTYDKIIEFFFNKAQFARHLIQNSKSGLEDIDHDTRIFNEQSNIKKMLVLLFPTKYPVYSNVYDSYNYVIKKDRSLSNYMMRYTNPFITKNYSYIKLNNEIYTITRLIWINDFLNHPAMVDICDKYRELLLKAKDTNTAIHSIVSKRRTMSSESTEIPIELREFEMAIQSFTKSQYRYADKELMNINLQSLFAGFINYIEKKRGAKQLLVIILDLIHKNYYESKSLSEEETTKIQDYMYVGTIKNRNTKRREVTILCDFIEGEVTDKNKGSIFCKYGNNKLGHLLENIFDIKNQVNQNYDWYLYGNREFLHSLITNEGKKSVNKTIKRVSSKEDDSKTNSSNILNVIYKDTSLLKKLSKYNNIILNEQPQLSIQDFITQYINSDIIESISEPYYDPSLFEMILDEISNVKIKLEKSLNQRSARNVQQEQQKKRDEERYNLIITVLNKFKDKERKKISKYGGNNKTKKSRKVINIR